MKTGLPFSFKGGNKSAKIYTEEDITENAMKGITNKHHEWTEWLGKFFHSQSYMNNNQTQNLNIKYIKASETK